MCSRCRSRRAANAPTRATALRSALSGTALLIGSLFLASCQREQRDVQPAPTRLAIYSDAARQSTLRPGGAVGRDRVVTNPYNATAYDVSEGQRLYEWFNCSGCHAGGGGGIGPPLIKSIWI